MWYSVALAAVALFHISAARASSSTPPSSIAAQYSLSSSTSLPFPTATQPAPGADSFITSQWSLSPNHLQNGQGNIAFVDDPFPSAPAPVSGSGSTSSSGAPNASGPVLQVTYPAGSYSHDTGGAQWYATWGTGTGIGSSSSGGGGFNSMLLTYDVAFDSNFTWAMGGKLPGLRGGPDVFDCSGGSQPNGSDCFSTRLMWRPGGAGEVYGYVLSPEKLCSKEDIVCNSDFGVSIDRGSYTFQTGRWARISMLVQLNSPPSKSNGNLMLYYNDVLAISQQGLQFRNSSDVNIGGLFFSTFFGGNNASWATPITTHTYFRNFQMWGSSTASSLPSGASSTHSSASGYTFIEWTICVIFLGLVALL
ncbi:polysaccharide lyase family 14 protein [Coniophora puteana RWD-64-598 SS2]|uniref:Polysaccharide lyase family 14 protein n=1 Tax=Coniophora puteana (strain RWD-64-598) TaxID=741705 RepID=A0A5M3MX59_CONPW|nr:polysaccharide lyase family 14 protein [Coniophora puteana RWD-64-598 SS2]EIW83211.1 polysaccharide lyase family 14 protein [Coniophora puteana RWD-64-598 SS2]